MVKRLLITSGIAIVSATELSGSASTSVLYRDFGLAIPDSPSVDTVADEVRLELDFVAQIIAG